MGTSNGTAMGASLLALTGSSRRTAAGTPLLALTGSFKGLRISWHFDNTAGATEGHLAVTFAYPFSQTATGSFRMQAADGMGGGLRETFVAILLKCIHAPWAKQAIEQQLCEGLCTMHRRIKVGPKLVYNNYKQQREPYYSMADPGGLLGAAPSLIF